MIAVNCPHLIKRLPSACDAQALNKIYRPSDFQLSEYCRRKSHWKCPFYQASEARGTVTSSISSQPFSNTDKTLT